jgi:alpha-ribazole phosphatase
MDLFLVRHASSQRKSLDVWGRLYDAGLDLAHIEQLDATRTALATLKDRTIFSSPLLRCVESARIIFGIHEPVVILDEIRAYHSGTFEDKSETYVRTYYPAYTDKTFKERFVNPEFGEESISAQALRVRRGLLRILEAATANAVVVTHYSVINIVAGLVALDFDPNHYAEGRIDISEGGLLHLVVEREKLRHALAPHRDGQA